MIPGQLSAGQFFQQVVLHTAAGQGADNVAVGVASQQGANRPGRGTPGANDRGEPAGVLVGQPLPDLADHFFVYCVHGCCILLMKSLY
jgi:hypothetical protein